jgi:hypothetical protein
MNILVFVTALILALSALTYARLDSYIDTKLMRSRQSTFMQEEERQALNRRVEKSYDKHNISRKSTNKNKDEGNKEAETKANLNKKLDIALLFAEKESEASRITYTWLRELIVKEYEKKYFFDEMMKKKSLDAEALVDRLLTTLIETGKSSDKKIHPKRIRDINEIVLEDKELSDLLYDLIKKPDSLYEWISFNNTNKKLSVYRCDRALLNVVYNDSNIVEEILHERYRLYYAVKNKKIKKQDASKEFEEQFKGLSPHKDLLDFRVRSTKPKDMLK